MSEKQKSITLYKSDLLDCIDEALSKKFGIPKDVITFEFLLSLALHRRSEMKVLNGTISVEIEEDDF